MPQFPFGRREMAERIKNLQADQILFSEGEAADCAYIIESGELQITTESEGESVTICTLGPGEIVGEMGIIDSSPRTATATAVTDVRLTVVTHDQFTERITQADPILRLLIDMLLERYRSGLTSVKERQSAQPRDDVASDKLVSEYIKHGIDKIRLESELKEALAQGQLRVLYQPVLHVGTRKVAGFEALTRWEHPERGPIPPGLFIALAEETSLIVPVGLYVLEEACKGIKEIEAASPGDPLLFCSINVSARQVLDSEFLGQVSDIIKKYNIDPSQLRLEITEGLRIDLEKTSQWVADAKAMGFKVALDDFGTGYSSLDTIHRLDVDVAKIDREFMHSLDEGPRSRDLVRGIVSMIKSLGIEIIVEGVETQHQLEFIWALDCEYGQGFLIGHSLDLLDAKALLQTGVRLSHWD